MQWELEGMRVEAMYMGSIPIKGIVEMSRVAYGGTVKHTVVLDQAINVYGATRDRVVVEHAEVTRVSDNNQIKTEVYSPFETVNS